MKFKLKKRDLVVHETGEIVTVLKTYTKSETNEEIVQVFNENGIFHDKLESFKPMDCMLLRCNSCNKESYEIELDVNEKQMYICDCGSSTFTPLNIVMDEEIYNY